MRSIRLTASVFLLSAVCTYAGTVIQFGGGASNVSNANWQTQIGADEIIQWNGVNSWGGSFGANGSVGGTGQPVGATLYSSNSAVTLTSVAISSDDPAGTNTYSTSNPNILGVGGGGSDTQFNTDSNEAWTVSFDANILLKQVIVAGLDFDGETVQIVIDGATNSFNRLDANCSNTTWVAGQREVYTFPEPVFVTAGKDVEISATQGNWSLQGIVLEIADYLYAEDFDGALTNLVNSGFDTGNARVRFGGNATNQLPVGSTEWAGKTQTNSPPQPGFVGIYDDGTGTNNLIHLNGKSDKSVGVGFVLAPEELAGGTSGVARLSFDLTLLNRKGDGSDGFLHIYEGSGYDLSGVTDKKIILDLVNAANVGTAVFGANGASASKIASLTFTQADVGSNLYLSFPYSDKAIIGVWETTFKTEIKFDDVLITDDGVVLAEGDSSVVFFGGDASIINPAADPAEETENNLFVGQTDAGAIIQWNGVNSDGGGFGASGTVGGSGQGVGAALTDAGTGLILTTTDIVPTGSNTVSAGSPNVLGVVNAKFDSGEAWQFEFNEDALLKQLVISAFDSSNDVVEVTVAGLDNRSIDLQDANLEPVAWEGAGSKFVYTYPSSMLVPAGTSITIAAGGTGGEWGLQGIVAKIPTLFESLTLIDFGGPNNKFNDAAYQSDLGEGNGVDAILAWYGDDIYGRFQEFGDLNDEGVGGSMTSLTYNVAITTLALSSDDVTQTVTTQNGGKLGVSPPGGNALFTAADNESWTFEWDKDVVLFKVGFKAFTGGTEEAEIIIGGVTNTIIPADTVAATHEAAQLYTFPTPVEIPAFTDVQVNCTAGEWGIRQFLVGVTNAPGPYPETFEEWAASYGLAPGTESEDPDGDGYDNLWEYAQGGNPTNSADVGTLPDVYVDGGDITYIYHRKKDYFTHNLIYTVLVTDDLVNGTWETLADAGFTQTGVEIGTDLRAITNTIPVSSTNTQQFISVEVSK